MTSLACGRARGPAVSYTHSADHTRATQPRARVATYLFSASEEGSSIFIPTGNGEKLPWTSSDIVLLAESGSSRPGMEVETLQGVGEGRAGLSGGTARGGPAGGAWASTSHSELPLPCHSCWSEKGC